MGDVVQIDHVESFQQNEDERLEEVGEFAEVVKPAAARDLNDEIDR